MTEFTPNTEKSPEPTSDSETLTEATPAHNELLVEQQPEDESFLDDEPEVSLSRKQRAVKTAGKILIGVIVLLLVAVGGGFAYVWYTGQGPAPTSAVESASTVVGPINRAPIQPAADAAVNASVQMLSTPIMPGMTSSLTIKTLSGANCTINAEYNKIKSNDPDLAPKVADPYGLISWQWNLAPNTPYGDGIVEVTCERNGKSAMVRGTQTVVRSLE